MSDSQRSTVFELVSNDGLNYVVSFGVDIRRGFVDQQYLCSREQRSRHTHELSLANRKG